MENFKENELKLVGAKVPIEFAEDFSVYCRREKVNQRMLFYNLMKWWMGLPESTQWLIYRGKVQEAHQQIAREVEADDIVSGSEADAAEQKQKRHRPRRAKSG